MRVIKAWLITLFLSSVSIASESRLGELSQQDIDLSGIGQCLEKYDNEKEIDLCILDSALNYIHPNMYFHIGEKEYEMSLEVLRNRAKNLNYNEFKLAIAEFVAQLQDSHTYVDFIAQDEMIGSLYTSLVSGKVKILNFTNDGINLGPLNLLSINGIKTEHLIDTYSRYFPMSNMQPDRRRAAGYLFAIYSTLNPEREISLGIELSDGKVINARPTGYKYKKRELIVSHDSIICSVNQYVLIKIAKFDGFGDTSCINDVMNKLKNEDRDGGYNLVIDLRGNPGGDPDVARNISKSIFGIDVFDQREKARLITNLASRREPLYREILDLLMEEGLTSQDMEELEKEMDTLTIEKIVEFEVSIVEGGYRNISYIDKSKPPGYFLVEMEPSFLSEVNDSISNIYILTSEKTASVATLFALYSREHFNAKLIGQGIGGSSRPFGSHLKIVLPNTKLPIFISSAYIIDTNVIRYSDIVWPELEDSKIVLDYYLNNKDSQLLDSNINEIHSIIRRMKEGEENK
ncbi:S41 family peptidase [Ferrimonas balearica]|uniref:S41 family peptidase n=1 Tax=Ferrimonas balearica TaxID=44012 RepID=UPI001C5616F1|nr:S41 family peptidase [Ferrimonas balearica]MBW3164136.1 hypothetical protein [Ferrimonas balearica]